MTTANATGGNDPGVQPTWSERLRAPFPPEQISHKPKPWCAECRKAQSRVCNKHKMINCPKCKQRITEAHVDLSYVGHADVTERLNQVDPKWDWWPVHRAIDKELLLAAVTAGNSELVEQLTENSPPLIDANGGMWIKLLVHDDEGNQCIRMGYGDSSNVHPSAIKSGGDLMKELIGDAIRNAAMRFGVALDLWSKSDRARDEVDAASGDGKLQTTGKRQASAKNGGGAGYYPGEDESRAKAESKAEPDDETQKLAQLAADLVERRATPEELYAQVYEPAKKVRGRLSTMVTDPVTGDRVSLSSVITAAKATLLAQLKEDQEEADHVSAGDSG